MTALAATPAAAADASPAPEPPDGPARVAIGAALLACGVCVAVMLGWFAGIAALVSVRPGWPATSPLTALVLVLLSLALATRRWRRACAAVAALASGLRLAAHAVGWDPGIDTLGLVDPRGPQAVPVSMSLGTALAMLLLAVALLLAARTRRGPAARVALQASTLLALLVAWLGLSRFVFGGEPLLPLARMALPTAAGLLLLGVGVLCRAPREGLVGLLTSHGPGGAITRRLLMPALVLPPLAGWLRLQGTQAGWFGAEAGLSMFTAVLAMAFGALLWANARLLDRADAERGQAAARVLASQQELQAIVGSTLDAVITIDEHSRVTTWSPHAETTFGWTTQQALGRPLDALIVPERHRQAHREGLARYLATGRSTMLGRHIEMTALHRDGREFPVDVSIAAIRAGDALRFSAFVRDISLRKRAEAAMAQLAAIVESSEDAIFSKTPDGTIASWNHGAERLFGYSAAEIVGRPVLTLVPDRLVADELDALERVRRDKRSTLFEAVRRRKDGSEVEVSVQLSPILGADGQVVGESSITRDITAFRRHAAELQRSNAELEQFAYVASHDLQEPLRMVANYTELLAKRYQGKLDEKADRYIHYASDGARRMQRLVSDLLAFSRVGSQGKPLLPTSAQHTLHRVLETLGRTLREARATVEFDALPVVLADEDQLGLLFQNLIGNAVKFHAEATPRIVVRAARLGAQWQFSVADNGIGMEMRFADRIFQMFQRLHEIGRYEGSGIGLAIAKRIVERHGGRIWVESAPGVGTTFHFTLPDGADAGPTA